MYYKVTDNTDKKCNIPWVNADELGSLREILFSHNGKQFKNITPNRETEMHVSFEFRDTYKKIYGYITRNATTDVFTDSLLQENRWNQHIHFIEWKDRWNCVVGDGIYISQCNFFMEKSEVEKLLARMIPCIL